MASAPVGLTAGTEHGPGRRQFRGGGHARPPSRERQPGRQSRADDHLGALRRYCHRNSARFDSARRNRIRPGHVHLFASSGNRTGRGARTDPGGDLHAHGRHRLRLSIHYRDHQRSTGHSHNRLDQSCATTYGTPLGSGQLDATAFVPGTAYSSAAGTVVPALAGCGSVRR